MIFSMLLPIAAAAAFFWAFFRKDETQPTGVPPVTPEARDAMIVLRNVNGTPVQYFRDEMLIPIMNMMTGSTLAPMSPQPAHMPGAVIYQVVAPGAPGGVSAAQAITQGAAEGATIMGSITLPMPIRVGRYLCFCRAEHRINASDGKAWVVLMDAAGTMRPPLWGKSGGGGGGDEGEDILTPPTYPPPGADRFDSNLPPELRVKVEKQLADPKADPFTLEDSADALAPSYPKTAATLRNRATARRNAIKLDDAHRGHALFTIRSGDIASNLAKYYTGNPGRWKEIIGANPGMSTYTKDGSTQIKPWHGTIGMPLDWNTRDKRLPKTLSGSPRPLAADDTDPEPLGGKIASGKGATTTKYSGQRLAAIF